MIVRIIDCEYNIYSNTATLDIEVHEGTSNGTAYTLTLPLIEVQSEETLRAAVERELFPQGLRLIDWSGLAWNVVGESRVPAQ